MRRAVPAHFASTRATLSSIGLLSASTRALAPAAEPWGVGLGPTRNTAPAITRLPDITVWIMAVG